MTREEAIKELQLIAKITMWNDRREAVEMAIKSLEDRPTGEWIQEDLCAYKFCSCCNYAVWGSEAEEYNYCPNCGAIMVREGGE